MSAEFPVEFSIPLLQLANKTQTLQLLYRSIFQKMKFTEAHMHVVKAQNYTPRTFCRAISRYLQSNTWRRDRDSWKSCPLRGTASFLFGLLSWAVHNMFAKSSLQIKSVYVEEGHLFTKHKREVTFQPPDVFSPKRQPTRKDEFFQRAKTQKHNKRSARIWSVLDYHPSVQGTLSRTKSDDFISISSA